MTTLELTRTEAVLLVAAIRTLTDELECDYEMEPSAEVAADLQILETLRVRIWEEIEL